MKRHRHHIIPRHAGGTDDPTNLVSLTIPEHAEAHRVLWEQHGRLQDKLAWLLLSGKTEEAEATRIALAQEGFREFLNSDDAIAWKERIRAGTTGRVQSADTRRKRSESLKTAYREGRHSRPKYSREQYSAMGSRGKEAAAQARRQSNAWQTAVRSTTARYRKMFSSPRRSPIILDGIEYPSIRDAARRLGIPYATLRSRIHKTA